MKYYPNFSDVFDDLFDSGVNTTKANTMLCDIRETENTYEMNIALPGYKKEDIALELKNGYLKVSASAKKEETAGRIVRRERYSGNCSRSFYVGEEFTEEDIKAKFDNGELMMMKSGILCKIYSEDLSKDEMVSVISSMQTASIK